MSQIEINGVAYEPVQRNNKPMSKGLFQLVAMASMFGPLPSMPQRKRPEVDIVEEYKLILEKKSNLSARDLEWVMDVFKANYKPVNK